MDDERRLFEENYKLNRGKIYHMIGRYISDACTVEDLTQHTFMKAWVKRQTFRGQSSYNTWLTAIAINTALSYLQQSKIRPQATKYDIDIDKFSDGLNTLSMAITEQEFRRILNAINTLPAGLNEVVVLNIIYGFSYEEVAIALDIPIGTVRSRIHRARYALKDLLK